MRVTNHFLTNITTRLKTINPKQEGKKAKGQTKGTIG